MSKLTKEQQNVWDRLKYGTFRLDPSAWSSARNSHPDPVAGVMYFNIEECKVYVYDGVDWVDIS